MRLATIGLSLVFLGLTFTSSVVAQESAAETASKLRQQQVEVQTKEAELRIRLQQIEEALKPENIERALAGIGSTKPEELREHRRRQLTIEKNGVLAQLKTLEASRSRLESAISTADSQSYQQSAQPSTPISNQMLMAQPVAGSRWLLLGAAGAVLILIGGAVVFFRRRK
jgi:transcriptional antiterminator Rof (Rho-off)